MLLVVCVIVITISQIFGSVSLVYLIYLGGLLYIGFLIQVIGISG